MSRPKTIINPKRAENLKKIIDEEGLTQTAFAIEVHFSQQFISDVVNKKTALREETAQEIISIFPKYRIEWLLGYDDYMTHEDFTREYTKSSDSRNNALQTVLTSALHEVCTKEELKTPTLHDIPELLLLEAQLYDYAVSLMRGYLHRNESHVWNYLDDISNKKEKGSETNGKHSGKKK